MKCLCCGKTIDISNSEETAARWHKRCIKKFFGTKQLPQLDLTEENLKMIADETVGRGYTLQGVQKKLSLHLEEGDPERFTIVNYPCGYILKPQTKEYAHLPEFEYLAMQMAELTHIKTVPHALLSVGDELFYITKRVDRRIERGRETKKYAMEDFCQLAGRLTEDKYKGSYERCGKIIEQYSARKGIDQTELYIRIVFSFVIGNSDMHLKNFSLIETEPAGRQFQLSPAYDLLPVNVILPDDPDEMALTVNGKPRNIRRKDVLALAKNLNINLKAAEKMIAGICKNKEIYLKMCDESYLDQEEKEVLKELISRRIEILEF